MTKKGGTTLFMLGVAGTGLAVAMFFDALKPRDPLVSEAPSTSPKPVDDNEEVVLKVTKADEHHANIGNEEESADDFTLVEEDNKSTESGSSGKSSKSSKSKRKSKNKNKNRKEEEEPSLSKPIDYKEYFRRKRDEWIDEVNRTAEDNSYRGDGSAWDKRMYFIKQAYKRSREATPVDPLIKAAVRMNKA